MDIAALVTVLIQLGLAASAWRLATTLKDQVISLRDRVNGHEARLGVLETRAA